MAAVSERIIFKRPSHLPITFFYDVDDVSKKIEKFSTKMVLTKGPIELLGIKYLYTVFWNFFSYLELFIRLIIPGKYVKTIYITFLK